MSARLSLCMAKGCGRFFRQVSPPSNHCPVCREPRVVPVVIPRTGKVLFALEVKKP